MSIPVKIAVGIITCYQALFSSKVPRCRFLPTCSEYAKEALIKKGFFKGNYKILKRILRCHPWGGHGYDPVD